jgi:hypothetical protein
MFFFCCKFSSQFKNKREFFFLFVCGKTTFLYRDKYRTLTYRKLTGFVKSFAYLGFLYTRLSLGQIFFQYLWFLGIRLPLGQDSIKLDFQFFGLLSTLLGVA